MSKFALKTLAGLIVFSAVSTASYAATTTSSGGTIHFTGEVVNAACAVAPQSGNMTIQLGQVRSKELDGTTGKLANKQDFKIALTDCDSMVSQNAQVALYGDTSTDDNSALSVSSITTIGTAATGVGIQVLDSKGVVIQPNTGTGGAASTILDGNTYIPLSAQFISTKAAVTPGAADADVTFSIIYS